MEITLDYLKTMVAEYEEYDEYEEGAYFTEKHELSWLFDDDKLQEIVDHGKEEDYGEDELTDDILMLFDEKFGETLKSATVKDNTGKVIYDYSGITNS